MNKLHKIIFLVAVFLMASVTFVLAQARHGQGTPEEKAKRQAQKWKTELGLTDSQTASLEAAIKTRITSMQALRGKPKDDEGNRGQERKKIREEFEAQVKAILTPAQYKEYERLRDEKKEKMKEKKGKKKGKHKHHLDDDDEDDM